MRPISNVYHRRQGMASLELVLVFPMLLALVCGIFLIARADEVKVRTATLARQQTWQKRPQASAGARGPLAVWQVPMDSEVRSNPQRPVPMGFLFRGEVKQAQSRNAVTANPWAYLVVPFATLPQTLAHMSRF